MRLGIRIWSTPRVCLLMQRPAYGGKHGQPLMQEFGVEVVNEDLFYPCFGEAVLPI